MSSTCQAQFGPVGNAVHLSACLHNFLDGGSAFYDTYRTKDEKFMAVGALEPHFFAKMSNILSEQGCLETGEELEQFSGEDLRNQLTRIFSSKDQSEWAEIFDGTDACVTPVVDTHQAHSNPHNVARSSFVKDPRSSKYSPVPAPKLSRTPAVPSSSPDPSVGQHSVQVLKEIGYSKETINQLLKSQTNSPRKYCNFNAIIVHALYE